MARGKKLDYETCVSVWELTSTGAKGKTVAKAMGLVPATVSRIHVIFKAVRDDNLEEIAETAEKYTNVLGHAKMYFATPAKEKEPAEYDLESGLEEICSRLSAISYGISQMNAKLEKLCVMWEGK